MAKSILRCYCVTRVPGLGQSLHYALDVINDANDPVGVGCPPVDDGINADGDAIARQNLRTQKYREGRAGRER